MDLKLLNVIVVDEMIANIVQLTPDSNRYDNSHKQYSW